MMTPILGYNALTVRLCVFIAIAVGLALTVLFLPYVIDFARKHNLFDTEDERRMHTSHVPRLGGVFFFPLTLLGVVLMLVFYTDDVTFVTWKETIGFGVAMSLIYVIGLCDDLKGLGFVVKLVGQILAGLCLCLGGIVLNGVTIHGNFVLLPEYYGWIATVSVMVLMTNSFNFIDGIDALAASLGIVAAATLTACSVAEGYPVMAIGAASLIGALAGFLVFNLAHGKKASLKVFMGDCGSLTMGGIITTMVILFLRAPHTSFSEPWILTPLLLPVLDAIWVIGYRLFHVRSPFKPDKHHIHHHLVVVFGSQLKTTAFIVAIDLLLLVTSVFVSQSQVAHSTCLFVATALLLWVLLHLVLIYQSIKNKPNGTKN